MAKRILSLVLSLALLLTCISGLTLIASAEGTFDATKPGWSNNNFSSGLKGYYETIRFANDGQAYWNNGQIAQALGFSGNTNIDAMSVTFEYYLDCSKEGNNVGGWVAVQAKNRNNGDYENTADNNGEWVGGENDFVKEECKLVANQWSTITYSMTAPMMLGGGHDLGFKLSSAGNRVLLVRAMTVEVKIGEETYTAKWQGINLDSETTSLRVEGADPFTRPSKVYEVISGTTLHCTDAAYFSGGSRLGNTSTDLDSNWIGWNTQGDYVYYLIDVKQAGTYNIDLVMTTGVGHTAKVELKNEAGEIYGSTEVPNTSWDGPYVPYTVTVDLPAGEQGLFVYYANGVANLRSLSFMDASLSPEEAKAQLEEAIANAEQNIGEENNDYVLILAKDLLKRVDTASTKEITQMVKKLNDAVANPKPLASVGFGSEIHFITYDYMSGSTRTDGTHQRVAGSGENANAEWNRPGDYIDFQVNVTTAGYYEVGLFVSDDGDNKHLQLRNENDAVYGSILFGRTGGWDSYQEYTLKTFLNAGKQILRVYFVTGDVNFRRIYLREDKDATAATKADLQAAINAALLYGIQSTDAYKAAVELAKKDEFAVLEIENAILALNGAKAAAASTGSMMTFEGDKLNSFNSQRFHNHPDEDDGDADNGIYEVLPDVYGIKMSQQNRGFGYGIQNADKWLSESDAVKVTVAYYADPETVQENSRIGFQFEGDKWYHIRFGADAGFVCSGLKAGEIGTFSFVLNENDSANIYKNKGFNVYFYNYNDDAKTGGDAIYLLSVRLEKYVEEEEACTHGETEVRDVVTGDCNTEGYTGDTYCKDCGEKTADGENTGLDMTKHNGETEVRDVEAATCGKDGYTGNTYCLDCKTKIADGKVDPATGNHEWDDGVVIPDVEDGSKGVKHFECDNCDETKDEPVTFTVIGELDEEGVYTEDGVLVPYKGLIMIDGSYYYVDKYAKIVKNDSVYVLTTNGYPMAQGYYAFDEEGKLVTTNGLYGDYYYINGVKVGAYYGLVEFEGNYYYVDAYGKIVKNATAYVLKTNGIELAQGYYNFDADGKLVVLNGLHGDYYYIDGVKVGAYYGLVEVEGDYYYVDAYGKIVKNATAYVLTTNGIDLAKGYYSFDADGKLSVLNGLVGDYYYINGQRVAAYYGLVEVEGDYYYVDAYGKIVKNATAYVLTTNGIDLAKGYYSFDADGKLIRE